MRLPTNQVLGIKTPPDGFTDMEKALIEALGDHSVESLYAKLPTSRMKFIVAAHFELGYDQEVLARILGITQEMVHWEIDLIRKVLKNEPSRSRTGAPYKPRRTKEKVDVEDILAMMVILTKP